MLYMDFFLLLNSNSVLYIDCSRTHRLENFLTVFLFFFNYLKRKPGIMSGYENNVLYY